MKPKYFVGTSGWHYEHWREVFYPGDLPKARWLEFYANRFATVELNNSFYRLPSEGAFGSWRDSTPHDFVFAVKVSRFITHVKRLRNADEPLQNFLSRARLLREKLGPLLYQLPPNMKRNDETLRSFLSLLPQELEHVFEFRNESWFDDEAFQILRQHNIGLCVFDMPDLTTPIVTTADFAYIRFHGSTWLYGGCYSDEELKDWAKRIASLSRGLKAAYIYFNNDAEGFAAQNANTLRQYLQLEG